MKKKFLMLIAAILVLTLVLALTGCGSGDSGDEGSSGDSVEDGAETEEAEEPEDEADEAAASENELAEQLEIVYEKAFNEKTPTLDTQQAMMLMAVKNNSDKTLDIEFNDTGVDKDGNTVDCASYGAYVQRAVAPGETRWFEQYIVVDGDDVNNIDHMSGGSNSERFKVTESEWTSFSDQVEISGMQALDNGVTGIMGTNNSDKTGRIDLWILFKKDGEPVYFTSVAICNLKDGEIAFLEPGESTEDPNYATCGGNDYDDYEYFVVANTSDYN